MKQTVRKTGRPVCAEPLLLTPGPLTTSSSVKQAMLHDYGARDDKFIELSARVCRTLLKIANAGPAYQCIPLQGSGTFAVEAMLASLIPAKGKLLNLVNGAYGRRISEICTYLHREVVVLEYPEDTPITPGEVADVLASDPDISHVSLVYCETTSGLLNPVREIAHTVQAHNRQCLLDAMSAFGALPVDVQAMPCTAIAASSNKCLQGVPGAGFVIATEQALKHSAANAHSLSLDLHAQWQRLKQTGQWRFTPPVQCLLALQQALAELDAEGGPAVRLQRYQKNAEVLTDGMRTLGFTPYLADAVQAPIIITFLMPAYKRFVFTDFHDRLRQCGYLIYPGKLTQTESFRIGCIGHITQNDMRQFIHTVSAVLAELDMTLI